MKENSTMGMNRTGAKMSPIDSKKTIQESRQTAASSEGDAMNALQLRSQNLSQSENVGTVPPPGSVKGVLSTVIKKASGSRIELMIDKLGERLAFERSGTRLYDGLINKCLAKQQDEGLDSSILDNLMRIRDEEAVHFTLLRDAMIEIGADPTAVTPEADVSGVLSEGIHAVVYDGRTTLTQGIHAMLVAEWVDNQDWQLLIELAEEMGFEDLAGQFRQALATEEEHLQTMQRIYRDMIFPT